MKSGDLVWRTETYLSDRISKMPGGPVILLRKINKEGCWLANIGIYTWEVLDTDGKIGQYTTLMLCENWNY